MRDMRSMDADDARRRHEGDPGGVLDDRWRPFYARCQEHRNPKRNGTKTLFFRVPYSATFCATDQTAAAGFNNYLVGGSVFWAASACDVALGARKVPPKVPFSLISLGLLIGAA